MTPADKEKRKGPMWEEVCTPIFNAQMGSRLRLMRMRKYLDQAQLGELLALPQKTISDLETGRLAIPRYAFTVEKLREVFEDDTSFILYGSNSTRYNSVAIQTRYHEAKFQKERLYQSGREHWTKRAKREGYPMHQDESREPMRKIYEKRLKGPKSND